LKRF
jgi:hypothetical protein